MLRERPFDFFFFGGGGGEGLDDFLFKLQDQLLSQNTSIQNRVNSIVRIAR